MTQVGSRASILEESMMSQAAADLFGSVAVENIAKTEPIIILDSSVGRVHDASRLAREHT